MVQVLLVKPHALEVCVIADEDEVPTVMGAAETHEVTWSRTYTCFIPVGHDAADVYVVGTRFRDGKVRARDWPTILLHRQHYWNRLQRKIAWTQTIVAT